MRITYISHTRFPSEKAYGMQIAQVCNALASLGHEVTLVAPDVRTTIEGDGHAYYGIAPSFSVRHIPTFDAINSPWVPGKLAFAVSMLTFRRQLRSFLQKHETDLIYVRSPMILPTLLATDHTVVLELHTLPRVGRAKFVRLCNKTGAIICLTSAMRRELEMWGVDPGRLLVEPDGVNLQMFEDLPSRADAKHAWDLPSDRPVIGYAGSLVTQDVIEKGVREFVGAFGVLRDRGQNFKGWIVGGPVAQLERYQEQASQLAVSQFLRFEGPIEPARVPSALRACDVLVYPAPASDHRTSSATPPRSKCSSTWPRVFLSSAPISRRSATWSTNRW